MKHYPDHFDTYDSEDDEDDLCFDVTFRSEEDKNQILHQYSKLHTIIKSGYIRLLIKLYAPQDIIHIISACYTIPMLLNVQFMGVQKYILYCPAHDNWSTLTKKINKRILLCCQYNAHHILSKLRYHIFPEKYTFIDENNYQPILDEFYINEHRLFVPYFSNSTYSQKLKHHLCIGYHFGLISPFSSTHL